MAKRKGDREQLSLFETPAKRAPRRVAPAAVDPLDAKSAAALPASIRLGTSSWSFTGWEGLVYDRKAKQSELSQHGLEAYGKHPLLRAVGIDRSYYAPVPRSDFEQYAKQVPSHFRFLVKAGQTVVSPREPRGRGPNLQFLDSSWARDYVVRPAQEGLGDKLGVILFQFPPMAVGTVGTSHAFARKLGKFLGDLPSGIPYAVELRNSEFLTRHYRDVLQKLGVDHCYNIHPSMPNLERQLRVLPLENNRQLIARWMLREGLTFESAAKRYAPFNQVVDEDLDARLGLTRLIRQAMNVGQSTIIIVNNKAEGSSPLSIFALAAMLP